MPFILSTAQHGPDIPGPVGLDESLQLEPEPHTSVGSSLTGSYDLVTTCDTYHNAIADGSVEIYHAELRPTSSLNNEQERNSIPVVVKIALTQDGYTKILHEGRFYSKHLGPLVEDHMAPICYGAFKVLNRTGKDHAHGCLILQDCGQLVGYGDVALRDRDPDGDAAYIRAAVLSAVRKLHTLGLTHGDLPFGHITRMPDRSVRIIGFTHAQTGHECQYTLSDADLWGRPQPEPGAVGCSEIYDVCEGLNIFVPGFFEYIDTYLPASLIEDQDLESIADNAPEGTRPAYALRRAYGAALVYLEEWFPEVAVRMQNEMGKGLKERCRVYQKAKDEREAKRRMSMREPASTQ
ncbi:unnamed protein product [Peniophora sp. CBMAI 1063]|nr:unnamed protein product [Peniophora sp. CBMAI 1063]